MALIEVIYVALLFPSITSLVRSVPSFRSLACTNGEALSQICAMKNGMKTHEREKERRIECIRSVGATIPIYLYVVVVHIRSEKKNTSNRSVPFWKHTKNSF